MSEQKILELIITLASVLIFVTLLVTWLKKIFRERREEVERLFRGKKILLQHNFAHFYGLESIGHFQLRGNGVLVLTADQLYFLKALPKQATVIPVDKITAVKNPRSHLGKSNITKLLRVEFTADNGEADAVAWMVGKDVDKWTEAVKRLV